VATRAQAARAAEAAFEVTLIQIGRRELRMADDTYRTLLANVSGGKTSSKALDAAQRQAVLSHMKACGFVVKPRNAGGKRGSVGTGGTGGDTCSGDTSWQREPQMRKLRAMWYVLADAGHVDRPADMDACHLAIETWAKRQINTGALQTLDAMRFATGAQMDKLIESMKRWLARLDLPTD